MDFTAVGLSQIQIFSICGWCLTFMNDRSDFRRFTSAVTSEMSCCRDLNPLKTLHSVPNSRTQLNRIVFLLYFLHFMLTVFSLPLLNPIKESCWKEPSRPQIEALHTECYAPSHGQYVPVQDYKSFLPSAEIWRTNHPEYPGGTLSILALSIIFGTLFMGSTWQKDMTFLFFPFYIVHSDRLHAPTTNICLQLYVGYIYILWLAGIKCERMPNSLKLIGFDGVKQVVLSWSIVTSSPSSAMCNWHPL